MDVRLIAAVGRSGQLGLNGKLPWRDPEDLRWFRDQTMGDVVIVGHNTFVGLPTLVGRVVVTPRRGEHPLTLLGRLATSDPGKTIWIAGGAKTYATFLPFVRRSVLTHIDYDGPADVYMPPLWNDKETTSG